MRGARAATMAACNFDLMLPKDDDKHIFLIEKWRDQAALDAHAKGPCRATPPQRLDCWPERRPRRAGRLKENRDRSCDAGCPDLVRCGSDRFRGGNGRLCCRRSGACGQIGEASAETAPPSEIKPC